MRRIAWLVAIALLFTAGATFAQFGGMGGGGGGMGTATRVGPIRRVLVEMEGGRRLSGQMDLTTLLLQGELGQYAIHPDKIKMIRFLKPENLPRAADDDEPAAAVGNARAMRGPVMMKMEMAQMNQMNVMGGMPAARAKVILDSGEEIIGNLYNNMGFHLSVDYGSITPAMDKLRSMTFSDAPRKPEPDTARPGEGSPRAAGGDANRLGPAPHYIRHAQALVVISPGGDRVMLHSLDSKQTLELSVPGDGPLEVRPFYAPDLMALALAGPRIRRIAVADSTTGWHLMELRQPVEGRVSPSVAQGVAVYIIGRYAYAYSAEVHRWDVAELPEGLDVPPVVGQNAVTIEGRGHIYTFAGRTGKWDHVNIRTILDTAQSGK